MKPLVRLGAESPFGLALPAATPSATQMYGPRGVWLDDSLLVVADTGNHRVLIWHGIPRTSGEPAHVVLGQPHFASEGPNHGGTERGLHMPTGVLVSDGRLIVADSWNHRILVWDRVPHESTPPDHVIGQRSLADREPQGGGDVGGAALYWPYNIAVVADWFWVADTGNRRVLGWPRLPDPGEAAHVILGQATPSENSENRGGEPAADSFRWPHAIAGRADAFFVADSGNHRVLGWSAPPAGDLKASALLGQSAFVRNEELPHRKQGAHRLRFPYGASSAGDTLAVADTANNRVLLWDTLPTSGLGIPAQHVIGQPDFDVAGENRWTAVTDDSLCWPYGVHLHGHHLAIADSGNNRVVVWDIARPVRGESTGQSVPVASHIAPPLVAQSTLR